jgi:hypothetical protein
MHAHANKNKCICNQWMRSTTTQFSKINFYVFHNTHTQTNIKWIITVVFHHTHTQTNINTSPLPHNNNTHVVNIRAHRCIITVAFHIHTYIHMPNKPTHLHAQRQTHIRICTYIHQFTCAAHQFIYANNLNSTVSFCR